jgi:hypothetical protein
MMESWTKQLSTIKVVMQVGHRSMSHVWAALGKAMLVSQSSLPRRCTAYLLYEAGSSPLRKLYVLHSFQEPGGQTSSNGEAI